MRMAAGCVLLMLSSAQAFAAASGSFTEADFRRALGGVGESVHLSYRGPDCAKVSFDGFAAAMTQPGTIADIDRAVDGTAVTATARRRAANACPAPYPPVSVMPPFRSRDLAGKSVSVAALKGKPTLMSFYFARCKPCILEVGPLNGFAAARPDMNFLAVTFDEAPEAREFVARYKLRWRVVAGARDFVERMRIKSFPTLALFDAEGRLLGTRLGGVRDELEAATIAPQLNRWVDGLLRTSKAAP
ncbi:MAG TPA: TlpA disulfide reductase family protein [Steroidobacteraceae bacterium]|nr:TlpA disulfide reductase family protein [Steroidobacteraceae bacterium]